MTVHERIRALREDMEPPMSQTELGKKLNKTQRAISRLETGESHLQDVDIVAYCKLFNVSADYILCLTDDKQIRV